MAYEIFNSAPNMIIVRNDSGREFVGMRRGRAWIWKTSDGKTPTAREIAALGRMLERYNRTHR